MPTIGDYVTVSGKRMRFAPTNKMETYACNGCHFYKKHLVSYANPITTKDNCHETGRATVCQKRGMTDGKYLVYVYPSHYKRYTKALITQRILGE